MTIKKKPIPVSPGLGPKRAVIYLRVSDPKQVMTDYDPEGISLPAQRKACQKKAEQMGLSVVKEYVEPGRSATEMARRKEFQAMLARIKEKKDVDAVIVYKLSRLARNRIDEALVMDMFRRMEVELVSATEPIDDTPEGQFMQGILSAMNQFRSQQDGADIAYKMGEKAKKGGTLGRAPIGYLNVKEKVDDGYEVRTVAVDPERAPFIRQAFELYRDGHTLQDICDILTSRGLTTKPTSRYPAQAITDGKMADLLRDPYYIGLVTYKGEIFPGRHPAIVDRELFEQVQEIAKTRGVTGARYRVHDHILKGVLWCGACHKVRLEYLAQRQPAEADANDETDKALSGSLEQIPPDRRMILQKAEGGGGTYWYFFCRGRQEHTCDNPYTNTVLLEVAVEQCYRTLAFGTDFIGAMKDSLAQTVREITASDREVRQQVEQTLTKLHAKEERLVDLAMEGTLPGDVIGRRLADIRSQRQQAEAQQISIVEDVKVGAANITRALDFLSNPYDMYSRASEVTKKQLNATIFERIYVHVDRVTDVDLRPGLHELKELERAAREFAAGERAAAQAEHAQPGAARDRQGRTAAASASKSDLALASGDPDDRAATSAPDGTEAATSSQEAPSTTKAAPQGGLSLDHRSLTRYLTCTFTESVHGSSKRPLVRLTRFERATFCSGGRRSIH